MYHFLSGIGEALSAAFTHFSQWISPVSHDISTVFTIVKTSFCAMFPLVSTAFKVSSLALVFGLTHPVTVIGGCSVFLLARTVWMNSYLACTPVAYSGQTSVPFCTFCSGYVLHHDIGLGSDFRKIALIPNGCPRCSYFPDWSGRTPCSFLIGQNIKDCEATYNTLTVESVRKVHGPLTNLIDTVPNRTEKAIFIQYWFGRLASMETECTYFWNNATNSYCTATPWESYQQQTPPPPPHQPVSAYVTRVQQMRQLWHFVEEKGVHPVLTAFNTAWSYVHSVANTNSHYTQLITTQTSHVRALNAEIEPQTLVQAPNATLTTQPHTCFGWSPSDIAQVVGPILDVNRVHNTRDPYSVLTAGECRLVQTPEPGQNLNLPNPKLHTFDPNSATAKRFDTCYDGLIRFCNYKNTMKHYNSVVAAIGKFEDGHFSDFSKPEMAEAFIAIEHDMVLKESQLPKCEANGKPEAVLKDKAQRLTYNHGKMVVAIMFIAVHTLESMIYGANGLFYDSSIKCRDRVQILDQFVAEHSKPVKVNGVTQDCCGVEIDQTGMELHERCDKNFVGSHGKFNRLLNQIVQHICSRLDNPFFKATTIKLEKAKDGMYINVSFKKDTVFHGMKMTNGKARIKIPDSCLTSGDLYTSLENFVNETIALYSSTTLNPEHFFAQRPDGRYYMNPNATGGTNAFHAEFILEGGKFILVTEDAELESAVSRHIPAKDAGTFDWTFTSIPLHAVADGSDTPASIRIYQRTRQEGDDGGGRTHHFFSFAPNRDQVIKNLRELGFNGKLVTTTDGRLELIGAHFKFANNIIDTRTPWCPAFSKNLAKLGVHATGNPRPCDSWSRANALAINCSYRLPQLRNCFLATARMMAKVIKDDDLVNVKLYSEVNRVFGISGTFRVSELQAKFDAVARPRADLNMADVLSIVSNSMQKKVEAHDMNMLGLLAEAYEEYIPLVHDFDSWKKVITSARNQETWYGYLRPVFR